MTIQLGTKNTQASVSELRRRLKVSTQACYEDSMLGAPQKHPCDHKLSIHATFVAAPVRCQTFMFNRRFGLVG